MRKIINISAPKEVDKKIDQAVKKHNFTSKSEFFRYLFRRWEEEKELEELQKSIQEVNQGKVKKLKSLKDLR
ncbi:MAG: ribbon-helix-helix domain-containing protein [Patescibacteria group bacterium]|nr:ribbon-helix-helix domain-containing protein [Patescibacteria group bacterium]